MMVLKMRRLGISVVLGLALTYGIISLIRAGEPTSIAGRVIVLAPGPGGRDPGASDGKTYFEKEVNLGIARVVRDHLEKTGARVLLTREADVDYYSGPLPENGPAHKRREDLNVRIRMAENARADWFISIHANAHTDTSKRGPVTFYYYNSRAGKKLAELIQRELNAITEAEYRREPTPNSEFYVLWATSMPALIIEVGFITNPEEYRMLQDPAYRELVARAITRGLIDYYR